MKRFAENSERDGAKSLSVDAWECENMTGHQDDEGVVAFASEGMIAQSQ